MKMIKQNKTKLGIFLLLIVLVISLVSAGSYSRSNPNYGAFNSFVTGPDYDDDYYCEAGQDFILQIAPFGCTPAVVRSDLLEEQNVPVFCSIAATKINPLIDVEAIESISFSGDYSEGISGIGFHPAKAALGVGGDLNSPVLENIGYAVIVLKKEPVEANMPSSVEGNLTARIKYDIKNAFGVGKSSFYLPQIENEFEWEQLKKRYSFWEGRAYLRAENIEEDRATIIIQDDIRKISSVNLKPGETSRKIGIPGFECQANLQLKLDGLVDPDTRARLDINGEIYEVVEGERFLDNKCRATNFNKQGEVEEVEIRCTTDEGTERLDLRISPMVHLKFTNYEASEEGYLVGQKMPFSNEGDKNVYLAYIGTKQNTGEEKDLYVRFVQVPKINYNEEFLTDNMLSEVARYDRGDYNQKGSWLNKFGSAIGDTTWDFIERFTRYLVQGTEIRKPLFFATSGDVYGEQVTLVSYGGTRDLEMSDASSLQSQIAKIEIDIKELEKKRIEAAGKQNQEEVNNFQFQITEKQKLIDQKKAQIPFQKELEKNNTLYYEKSLQDYERLITGYPREIFDSRDENNKVTYNERALWGEIQLAEKGKQKRTMLDLCEQFKEDFPDSKLDISKCKDKRNLANYDISYDEVLINNNLKRITLDSINEPKIEEYSAEITITNADSACNGKSFLRKNAVTCFNDTEYIILKELTDDYALFDVSSVIETSGRETFWKTNYLKIKVGEFDTIGINNYRVRLDKINLQKVAKVTVLPNVDNAGTTASFPFKVGIEKRAIQLSPDKTKERIDNLEKTIKEWEEKMKNLGKVVQGLKGACLATGAYLTVKNFLANTDGKSLARKQVMTGENGWNQKCAEALNTKKIDERNVNYVSIEDCIFEEASNIDSEVDKWHSEITKQNEELKKLNEDCGLNEGSLSNLFGKEIDTSCYKDKLLDEKYKTELRNNCGGEIEINKGGEKAQCSEIIDMINTNRTSIEQLRRMQLNSRLAGESEIAQAELNKDLKDIYVNNQNEFQRQTLANKFGFTSADYGIDPNVKTQEFSTTGSNTWGKVENKFADYPPGITDETYVELYGDKGEGGQAYLLVLNDEAVVTETYKITGPDSTGDYYLTKEENPNPKNIEYKKYDSSTYENNFKSVSGETDVVVKFYDTEPYKGLPAIVPFDTENGWYAATKQTLPTMGAIKPFDESGRAASAYICNVGENGIAEFKSGIGEDECMQFNTYTGQPFNQFPGLESKEATRIIDCGMKAIEQASKQYGNNRVNINVCGKSESFNVGRPAVDVPEMQCSDYMSPKECQLLFNVCDPVICPSSRCDLGGAYPVKDVIQSGIIGSIALCLPNIREGIYIPVCLTGIKAGIDGYLSIVKAHRDCLQESLDTGETVGICDEIYSIHACEFFWRQSLPIAKLVLPKLIEKVFGQDTRGGGEYLGVQEAWNTADKSLTYFTQYYAENSFAAFKARTAEDVGGEVCKSFVSGVYPEGGNLLDSLTEPDSPSQFHGRFDEVLFTSATVPPVSHYKVYYHIYAGEDRGAYFQVYLTEGPESSYYKDTSYRRIVDSGYIPRGEYGSETIDFTAPQGYTRMCIRVNNQEECGFKQVSTSLAVNYLEDKFLQEQASNKNIKTETECIAGTASLYSLASPSLQGAAEEIVSPAIYERGIIRVCATSNPSKGTDSGGENSRWVPVGYCDDPKIKCWVDKLSINRTMDFLDIKNQTLSELEEHHKKIIEGEGDYEKEEFLAEKIKEKGEEMKKGDDGGGIAENYWNVIGIVDEYIDRTFWNYQKSKLILNRADAYRKLIEFGAIPVYDEEDYSSSEDEEPSESDPGEDVDEPKTTGCKSISCGSKSIGVPLNVMGGDDCWIEVGQQVINIAEKVKTNDDKFSDSVIQADTEGKVKNFECLVAMIARQEGCLAHCEYDESKNDPFYCKGSEEGVVLGDNEDSIGIMQINKRVHGEHYGFNDNVDYGANYLASRYIEGFKTYSCNGEKYGGWTRALRLYNGWSSNCNVGDIEYVENVLNRADEIKRLFPEECGMIKAIGNFEFFVTDTRKGFDDECEPVINFEYANIFSLIEDDSSMKHCAFYLIDRMYNKGDLQEAEDTFDDFIDDFDTSKNSYAPYLFYALLFDKVQDSKIDEFKSELNSRNGDAYELLEKLSK